LHKVIKISHCGQCPYEAQKEICCYPVGKYRKIVTDDEVKLSCESKALPENCPLEEDILLKITKKKLWQLYEKTKETNPDVDKLNYKIFELWKLVSNM
jgi:hypothetical protein